MNVHFVFTPDARPGDLFCFSPDAGEGGLDLLLETGDQFAAWFSGITMLASNGVFDR